MKQFLTSLALLIACASPAVGQVIHDNLQKAAYASPTEWPFISAQSHVTQSNGMLGHTHVECNVPIWAETTTVPFTMPCQIQLFHMTGTIHTFGANFMTRAVWHHPDGRLITQGDPSFGQAWYQPPFPIAGDPDGVVLVKVDVTITPELSAPFVLSRDHIDAHGWWTLFVQAGTLYDGGHIFLTDLAVPFFSMIDPSQPIADDFRSRPFFSSLTEGLMAEGSGTIAYASWGGGDFSSMPPILAPLTTAQQNIFKGWEYPSALPAKTEIVADLDLHHGNQGRVLANAGDTQDANFVSHFVFDPNVLGAGPHKVAIWWDRVTDGLRFGSLLVVTVNVGGDAPSPELCGDHIDNDGDGLIDEDCPPPTEVCGDGLDNDHDGLVDEDCTPQPTWTSFMAIFEQLGNNIRICRPDVKCTAPIPVQ